MCSTPPTHSFGNITSHLHSWLFSSSSFSSTAPVTITDTFIVPLHWQKDYCEKVYLESNSCEEYQLFFWEFLFFLFLALLFFLKEKKRNHWIIYGVLLCSVSYNTAFVSPSLAMSGFIVEDSVLYFHLLRLRYNCLAFVTWLVHSWHGRDERML